MSESSGSSPPPPPAASPVPVPPLVSKLARLSHPFPTRQFPYRELSTAEFAALARPPQFALPAGTICRFIFGRDSLPRVMTPEEIGAELNDPFATLLLRRGVLPLTMRSLMGELDKFNAQPEGLPKRGSFLVADGGQIPWSQETALLNRVFRIAVVRHRGGLPELLVSTGTDFDSDAIFLQVFAWDSQRNAYNFYERRTGAWCWAGRSWDALAPDSRGKGPFDSHVNGGLVMKELKAPWMHWHSQAASIRDEVLAPGDTLREEALYRDRAGGEDLERFVRAGIVRWNHARFEQRISSGRLMQAAECFRQLLTTTTVNLTTSAQESRALQAEDSLRLPRTFFLHSDALLSTLELKIAFPSPKVDASHYLDCLRRYEVAVRDGQFSFAGDTHFAFPVPEPAFEDLVVLQELLARGIISRKGATALLMVDFQNPVFSPHRAKLLTYVPDEIPVGTDGGFESVFVPAVRVAAAGLAENTPERIFLKVWDLREDEWETAVIQQVQAYLDAVAQRLETADGFDVFFRLAESRRREFRRRPLAEFRLTTPSTNIPEDAPLLEMTTSADVQPKP